MTFKIQVKRNWLQVRCPVLKKKINVMSDEMVMRFYSLKFDSISDVYVQDALDGSVRALPWSFR